MAARMTATLSGSFVGLLLAALVQGFPDAFPSSPSVRITADDSSFSKYWVSFEIEVEPGSGSIDTCGYDLRLGVSANDMTGPLLEKFRKTNVGPVPVDSIETFSYANQAVRLFDSNQGTPSISASHSVGTDGNSITSYTESGVWITDAGSADQYYVLAFAVNCETNESINPAAGSVVLRDKYYPYLTPIIQKTTSQSVFSFTDTNPSTGQFSGTLVFFTDPAAEAYFGITSYLVGDGTFCSSSPGCTLDKAVFTTASEVSDGKWTVTLNSYTGSAPGNQIFIASVNQDGYGREATIRLTDLVPSPSAVTGGDLVTNTSAYMADRTPEKTIGPPAEVHFNFGDQMVLGIDMDLEGFAETAQVTYEWLIDNDGTDRVTSATGPTYGEVVLQPRDEGTYTVKVTVSDSTVTTPYITVPHVESLDVFVSTAPQRPEAGTPTIDFLDTDLTAGVIGGTLTITEASDSALYHHGVDDRQFDYYLIHLSSQPVCDFASTNSFNVLDGSCATDTGRADGDTLLGVVKYAGGVQTTTVSSVSVGDVSSTPKYLHVTTFEMTSQGAESKRTATWVVVDKKRTTPQPVPLAGSVRFFDQNGGSRTISGKVEFDLDPDEDYSNVDYFEVYLNDAPTFDSVAELGQLVLTNVAKPSSGTRVSEYLDFDSSATYSLDVGGRHLDYMLVISRSVPDAADPDGVRVPSSTAAYVVIDDRVDTYYFLEHLASHTSTCPGSVCPGGDPSSSTYYWPYAEQSPNVDGGVTVYWLTAALDSVVYEVSASDPRLAAYLGNTALDDMSGVFSYAVSLGSSTDQEKCDLRNAESWPFGAPSQWSDVGTDLTQRELFYIVADYAGLSACGFTRVASATGITLQGVVSLFVVPKNARTDSVGTTTPSFAPQLTLQALLTVVFSDATHATVASVTVDNVVTVDTISASVAIGSSVSFYSDAFLLQIDPSQVVFTAGSDSFHIEHFLTSNANDFYVELERMWFSQGPSVTDNIEYLVPQSSSAYTNVDTLPLPGRYRFEMTVPYLMNCKPCYMHLVSSLTPAVVAKALNGQDGPRRFSRASFAVFINGGDEPKSLFNGASHVTASVLGVTVTVTVLAGQF